MAVVRGSGKKRATNIAAAREYIRAKVESVKGQVSAIVFSSNFVRVPVRVMLFQFGFLHYEAVEGKKLFFHMTEVHDGVELAPGDEVEFVVVQNQRNQKFSAVSLRKIT